MIQLIDWDLAAYGHPLREFGNLLLTAYFDLTQSLQVSANEPCSIALVQGYQRTHPILPTDPDLIANSMRFLLAWQLGSYSTDPTLPDFPMVVQKRQAHYHATQAVANVAIAAFVRFHKVQCAW